MEVDFFVTGLSEFVIMGAGDLGQVRAMGYARSKTYRRQGRERFSVYAYDYSLTKDGGHFHGLARRSGFVNPCDEQGSAVNGLFLGLCAGEYSSFPAHFNPNTLVP
jgi:hypothetical protein